MKNPLKSLLPALFLLSISCDQDSSPKVTREGNTVNVTMQSTELYTHDFGMLGIEDRATIKKEPLHAEQSELVRNDQSRLIYKYKAVSNFKGKDEVEIELCHSIGTADCYAKPLTTLRFTVK